MIGGSRKKCVVPIIMAMMLMVSGCGNTEYIEESVPEETIVEENATEEVTDPVTEAEMAEAETEAAEPELLEQTSGIAAETATDGLIDFEALMAENPDIYAWLYIPDTDIDFPIVRANNGDAYYVNRNSAGDDDPHGAVYTEIYNSTDFSDFNTVIHGADAGEGDPFYGLHKYEDSDYFDAHRIMYVVTPYTTMTYEIIAAYYDDGSDIYKRYDYTTYSGCNRWITDYTAYKDMSMNRVEPTIPLSVDTSFIVTLDGIT
ncbi:MAG: class B sortase, partial [Lachnospiraceae bacterium]|nr:class B sortase [Lachnospiraceae bacterium]